MTNQKYTVLEKQSTESVCVACEAGWHEEPLPMHDYCGCPCHCIAGAQQADYRVAA